ncbi:MAG: sugar phosphate nucleotidyltransferase [Bacteroidales bacterium]|jgi:NDP-sugar pyrophosphorylase family protein
MNYAIIAAGEGSRLYNEGFKKPKPMVVLNNETLIERLIRIFINNNANNITIIINEQSPELKALLEEKNINIPIKIICKSTPSSLHSFYEIIKETNPEELCLTTVDTIFNEKRFEEYIKAFEKDKSLDALMAVTDYVDDEKPLWVSTNANNKITCFSSTPTNTSKYISGGIYCLRNKAIEKVKYAIENNVQRMRNYQQILVEQNCNLKAFSLEKIIDIDHISDIDKAKEFLKEENKILCISRNQSYSPNSSEKDLNILNSICENLKKQGFFVEKRDENEFIRDINLEKAPFFVLSMVRNPQVIELLEKWENKGSIIINSPKGCKNCYREMMINILNENSIPMPQTIIVDTERSIQKIKSSINETWIEENNFWIKRADFQTIQENDVIRPKTFIEANSILKNYSKRNIKKAIISKHIEGSVVKFYGVRNTSFFHWLYPTKDKFNNIMNSSFNLPFNEKELREIANNAANCLELDIYSGDAIIDNKNNIKIIDFNDFPSFSSCKVEAAEIIANYIEEKINK